MTLLRLLRTYLAPHRSLIWLLLVLETVSVLAILALPILNADLIDNGLARADVGHIWRAGGLMLLVTGGQVGASVVATYLGSRVATAFGRDLRRGVFERIGRFSTREVREFTVPSLITRCTNDVQQVQILVLMACTVILTGPILMVGGIVMAMQVDVGLSWLLLLAVPLLAFVVGVLMVRMVPMSQVIQDRLDTVNRVLREQLMGIRVIRAFVREPHENQRFDRSNTELTTASRRVGRVMASLGPIVLIAMYLTIGGVLWFGGQRVDAGQMQVGALAAYITYVIQILAATTMVSVLLVLLPRAAVCAERIQEVLGTEPSVRPPARPALSGPTTGVIGVEDLELRHTGAPRPVLSGITLRAEPGEYLGIIGSTGAGKTTLLSLLCRLLDPTGGRVTLDGTDLREIDPATLAADLGLVPQQPYLFSGTVASNLRLGRPEATDGDLWEALEVAQARDVVEALEEGLEAPVHPGGANFSGGQRQRLCLARAVVTRPRAYLLDDPFSALDLGTAARVQSALRPVLREATAIVVAQRVSTIAAADRIVVLDQGSVAGVGRHEELLVTCPTYREIVDSQQSEEVSV